MSTNWHICIVSLNWEGMLFCSARVEASPVLELAADGTWSDFHSPTLHHRGLEAAVTTKDWLANQTSCSLIATARDRAVNTWGWGGINSCVHHSSTKSHHASLQTWSDATLCHSCEFFTLLPSFKCSYFGLWWPQLRSHLCCHSAQIVALTDLCAELLDVYDAANPSKWERVVVKGGGAECLVSGIWQVGWMLLYEMLKSKGLYFWGGNGHGLMGWMIWTKIKNKVKDFWFYHH